MNREESHLPILPSILWTRLIRLVLLRITPIRRKKYNINFLLCHKVSKLKFFKRSQKLFRINIHTNPIPNFHLLSLFICNNHSFKSWPRSCPSFISLKQKALLVTFNEFSLRINYHLRVIVHISHHFTISCKDPAIEFQSPNSELIKCFSFPSLL